MMVGGNPRSPNWRKRSRTALSARCSNCVCSLSFRCFDHIGSSLIRRDKLGKPETYGKALTQSGLGIILALKRLFIIEFNECQDMLQACRKGSLHCSYPLP